jgi:hypothetical protein
MPCNFEVNLITRLGDNSKLDTQINFKIAG